jgi:catechol 2,3-dioxygenase-like lactoylglutathione lyase family enzyme
VIKELNHIGIRAGDFDYALAFYQQTLGGTIIRDSRSLDGKSSFVYIQLGDGVIELLSSKPGETNLGLQHVAFLVNEDLNRVYEALLAQGLVFTVQPRLAGSGNGYLAFFREPGGAVFELIQREENIRIPGLKNDVLLAFASSTIQVPPESFDRCAAFYRDTMEFSSGPVLETAQGRVQHFRHGRDAIELALGAADQPLNRLTFQVASCSALRDRLLERGLSCTLRRDPGAETVLDAVGPDGVRLRFVEAPV